MTELNNIKIFQRNEFIKIIVGGDAGVGKTTLLKTYVKNKFDAATKMTIGVQFFCKYIKINGTKITIIFWDFAGLHRFRFLHPLFVLGAEGGLLAFDLTRKSTLKNIKEWAALLRVHNPNLPILLIGMKADLKKDVVVEDNIILELKNKFNFYGYTKISSKTGNSLDQILTKFYEHLLLRRFFRDDQNLKYMEKSQINKRISNLEKMIESFKTDLDSFENVFPIFREFYRHKNEIKHFIENLNNVYKNQNKQKKVINKDFEILKEKVIAIEKYLHLLLTREREKPSLSKKERNQFDHDILELQEKLENRENTPNLYQSYQRLGLVKNKKFQIHNIELIARTE